MYRVAPSLTAVSRSSFAFEDVRMITGISRHCSLARTRSRTSDPSLFGSLRSSSTRSGRGARSCSMSAINSIALWPSVMTLSSQCTQCSESASLMSPTSAGLSSMATIRVGRSADFDPVCSSCGDGEKEGGTSSGLRFNPDAATHTLNDALANSEAHACSGVLG